MPSCRFFSGKLWVLLASVVILAVPMLGQTFFGSIVGTVSDSAGGVMPGVAVTLTNNGTGAVQTGTTSADGNYRFVNLVPGSYRVEAEQAGFRRYTRDNIRVEVESAVRVDVAMQIGEVTETVEVTADVPVMQTENANLSQVVAGRSVQEIPLNGRNVLNLVALVPGVVPQGLAMAPLTGQNVFAAGNYQIGGGSANQSASFFDGVPMNVNYGNLTALVPTQDAVSEFRVQTNSNSAEYGRYTGGVINIVSKSGTNEFHGGAYEFIRNKKLNATDFFANSTGAGKAAFTQNQFGAFVGGPIVRDKTFFYAGYEGYRQRYGRLYLLTVPTEQQLTGDFSQLRNSAGALIPVYDPLTQCGTQSNPACSGQTEQRQVFPNNQIPSQRFDSVAKNVAAFPYWAKPNTQGRPNTNQFNYSNQTSLGGNSDQLNFRGDHTWSDKQRIFGRYTWWESENKAAETYGNGLVSGDPVPPEYFLTQQVVFGDTYLFSPTTIFDIRLSYMRWYNDRTPGTLGIDLTTLGFPKTFKDGLPSDRVTVPRFGLSSPTYDAVGTGSISARTNNYVISSTLTKIAGAHTWKFGAELRRLDDNYWQNNNPGGTFNFNNLFTSRNALSPGATGDSFASFLLGYAASGIAETVIYTANGLRYQGYFVNDTWQVTPKLTVNLGLRWEIPGVHTERFDRQGSLNLSVRNPISDKIGQTVLGNIVLVKTPDHPERGLRPETYTKFAPRAGIAYRLNEKTVLRAGGGIFYIPSDTAFWESAIGQPLNIFANNMVSTNDGSVTPVDVLSNPFPNGLIQAPGRSANYEELILGLNIRAPFRDEEWGYTGQWNFALQREFGQGVAVEAAYAGLRGIHLPNGGWDNNVIPEQYLSLGAGLRTQVPNPFFGHVKAGPLSQRTVQQGQLLLRYPQFTGTRSIGYIGNSNYHSLQLKAEKRFSAGGRLLAAYTFSKLITDLETNTGWLDGGQAAGYQNPMNMRLERSLSSFDSRRRLVLSYVLDMPFGRGQRLGGSVTGVLDKLVSGWGINGVTTLQDGFPLGMTASPNQTGLGTGLRPNVDPSCDPIVDGAAQAKLNGWFNQSCYSVPAAFTLGTASRLDPRVRIHGIANFDFAVFKRTHITETTNIEFRTEFFNLFNRVQFGRPNNQATTSANSTFGFVTSQANQPRLIQFALRLNF